MIAFRWAQASARIVALARRFVFWSLSKINRRGTFGAKKAALVVFGCVFLGFFFLNNFQIIINNKNVALAGWNWGSGKQLSRSARAQKWLLGEDNKKWNKITKRFIYLSTRRHGAWFMNNIFFYLFGSSFVVFGKVYPTVELEAGISVRHSRESSPCCCHHRSRTWRAFCFFSK